MPNLGFILEKLERRSSNQRRAEQKVHLTSIALRSWVTQTGLKGWHAGGIYCLAKDGGDGGGYNIIISINEYEKKQNEHKTYWKYHIWLWDRRKGSICSYLSKARNRCRRKGLYFIF